jgi:hypothetical protein
VRNKMFFIVTAVVSLVAIVWWPSSTTDDPYLPEESDSALPKSENAKFTITPEVLYSPPTEAKPKPAHALGIKEPPLATQPVPGNETTIDAVREERMEGGDRKPMMTYDNVPEVTPTSEQLADAERYNEYETREEMKPDNTYLEAENPEMQNIAQQLQAMRDAGTDESVIREAEEKLIQSQQMIQRLQDQQSISKTENDNPENDSEVFP